MNHNYKIIITSDSSMTIVALATSKFILSFQQECNGENFCGIVLSVHTVCDKLNRSEIIVQVSLTDKNICMIRDKMINLINKIKSEYKVNIEMVLV